MTNKKLIYEDRNAAKNFEKSVVETAERSNYLIDVFNGFQPWKKITIYGDWIDLVSDPEACFDAVLLSNVDLKVTDGRKADPQKLADLLAVDRISYMNLVAGLPVSEADCIPCQKMAKIRKGTTAISLSSYQQYENYLMFNSGHFTMNEETVSSHKDKFRVYADTPARMEVVKFWQSLCDTLNLFHDRYHIAPDNKRVISKALKLHLSEGFEGRFIVDEQALSLEILNTK
jgi:hypothetical protein